MVEKRNKGFRFYSFVFRHHKTARRLSNTIKNTNLSFENEAVRYYYYIRCVVPAYIHV